MSAAHLNLSRGLQQCLEVHYLKTKKLLKKKKNLPLFLSVLNLNIYLDQTSGSP